MVVGLGAALLAALLFGVAAVVQAAAARKHGLVSALMGVVALIYLIGWGLHLVAIAELPLYVAQVAIATSLVVTTLLAAFVVKEPLRVQHWLAVGAMVVGLALLVISSGNRGNNDFDAARIYALYGLFLATLLLALVARRMPDEAGGVLLAALAGIAYGGSPVATRALVDPAWDAETIVPSLSIGLFGLLAFWSYSLAMRRTSVTAATAPLILLQTVLPAVIGLTLFEDQVRGGWWPLALAGFVLATLGAVVLSGAEARMGQSSRLEPSA